jgi:uncharacterized membrane protein YadS
MKPTTVTAVKWLEKLPPLRFGRSWAILSGAMLAFLLPVAAVAYRLNGPEAIRAAILAAGVCWLGATLTLAGTARFGRDGINAPMYTLACGLVFNCGLPFLVGLAFSLRGGELAQAGAFGLIVVFFQFALVVSTLLSLCLIKSPR